MTMRKTMAAFVLATTLLAPNAVHGIPRPGRQLEIKLPLLSEVIRKDGGKKKITWRGKTYEFDSPVVHFRYIEKKNALRVLTEAGFVSILLAEPMETLAPHSPKDTKAGIACGLVLADGNPVFVNRKGDIVFFDYLGGLRTREKLRVGKVPGCSLSEQDMKKKDAPQGKGLKTQSETWTFRTWGKGAHRVMVTVVYPAQ